MSVTRRTSDPTYYSNVPISQPVLTPDEEIRDMGGFAWTETGIRPGFNKPGNMRIDEIAKLRNDPSDFFGPTRLTSEGDVASG